MTTRAFVFSPDMSLFYGELLCRTVRAWTLNRALDPLPTATAYVSVADPALSEDLLRFRNILYITDGILPDWVGQVGEPQGIGQGEVEINATAAEIILDDRWPLSSLQSTPGAAFRQLISDANASAPCGISAGDIEDGDDVVNINRGTQSVLQAIQRLQLKTGFYWGISGSRAEGRMPVLSAWFRRDIGQDFTGEVNSLALDETLNLELDTSGQIMVKNGRVKNMVHVTASSGSSDNSAKGEDQDADSINTYGLAQFITAESAKSDLQAKGKATTALNERSAPSIRFAVTCNDPTVYPFLRLGSRYPLILRTVGFQNGRRGWEGTVRIIGMAYDDMVNKVELTLEDVQE